MLSCSNLSEDKCRSFPGCQWNVSCQPKWKCEKNTCTQATDMSGKYSDESDCWDSGCDPLRSLKIFLKAVCKTALWELDAAEFLASPCAGLQDRSTLCQSIGSNSKDLAAFLTQLANKKHITADRKSIQKIIKDDGLSNCQKVFQKTLGIAPACCDKASGLSKAAIAGIVVGSVVFIVLVVLLIIHLRKR